MRLKQTDQGKKSVTLWFEQEKDQGYRLTMVDATNLLDVKEKTNSEKEITTEKEQKRYRIRPAYSATRKSSTLNLGEVSDGGMGYRATYQVPGQSEVVMEFKKKPRNWCWYKKGDIIGRSTDRHQGSFLSPGWGRLEADLASIGMDNHQDTRSHSDTWSSPSSRDWFALRWLCFWVGIEGSMVLSRDGIRTEYLTRHSEPRQPVLDSQSDRTKTYSPSSKSGRVFAGSLFWIFIGHAGIICLSGFRRYS